MLKRIEEFDKYVVITGFRNVRIGDIDDFLNRIHPKKEFTVEVQFFNAERVASWQHLYFAAVNALTAFKNKENISKSVAMETVLYASAQRQIRKATDLLGIKSNTSEVAVLIIGENAKVVKSALSAVSKQLEMPENDTILNLSKEKMRTVQNVFEIEDLELETVAKKDDLEEALKNLVIERMALLATQH